MGGLIEAKEQLVASKMVQVLRSQASRLGLFVVLTGMGCHGAGTKSPRPEMLLSQNNLSVRTEAEAREEVESFLCRPVVASFPKNDK